MLRAFQHRSRISRDTTRVNPRIFYQFRSARRKQVPSVNLTGLNRVPSLPPVADRPPGDMILRGKIITALLCLPFLLVFLGKLLVKFFQPEAYVQDEPVVKKIEPTEEEINQFNSKLTNFVEHPENGLVLSAHELNLSFYALSYLKPFRQNIQFSFENDDQINFYLTVSLEGGYKKYLNGFFTSIPEWDEEEGEWVLPINSVGAVGDKQHRHPYILRTFANLDYADSIPKDLHTILTKVKSWQVKSGTLYINCPNITQQEPVLEPTKNQILEITAQ